MPTKLENALFCLLIVLAALGLWSIISYWREMITPGASLLGVLAHHWAEILHRALRISVIVLAVVILSKAIDAG